MDARSAFAVGLLSGFLFSIPPGPAGAIILTHSLRGATAQAARCVAAFLVADLLVVLGVLVGLRGTFGAAVVPWMKPAAGLFLLAFAVTAWRAAGRARGLGAASPGVVFRITVLNPAVWVGALSVLTVASTGIAGGAGGKILFIVGLELGALGWFLGLIFGARRIPAAWHGRIERGAAAVIGLTGLHFALGPLLSLAAGGR